jgi:DNA-directed RNA polymerase subunit RPC12/RpoP
MPVYKCPKCGRTVEKLTSGVYYCKVCGEDVVMEEVGLKIEVKPLTPGVPRFWVFTYPENEFVGSASTLSEAERKTKELAKTQVPPVSYMIVEVKKFVEAW